MEVTTSRKKGPDERIILKLISRKYDGRVQSG